ncbi:hypothetical protein AcV7_006123 [Taiwanofungus camphoratus]|nr:hypothetical protein AcV7_006123 [Antrodia cinnamomea]
MQNAFDLSSCQSPFLRPPPFLQRQRTATLRSCMHNHTEDITLLVNMQHQIAAFACVARRSIILEALTAGSGWVSMLEQCARIVLAMNLCAHQGLLGRNIPSHGSLAVNESRYGEPTK